MPRGHMMADVFWMQRASEYLRACAHLFTRSRTFADALDVQMCVCASFRERARAAYGYVTYRFA